MSGIQAIASILPSIRCSDCGADVELSLMGEHVCSKQSEPSPFPQLGTENGPPKSSTEIASNRPLHLKANKAPPPPPLRTTSIGSPLVPPNELTPASSGRGSNAVSPKSTSSARSPFRAPFRGMTMPSRARPPSPELTNLDCAFPPFPTKAPRSNTPVPDSRSLNSDHENSYVRAHAEPYNAPSSKKESASSSETRKRSKTVDCGANDAIQAPSTAGGGRRPALANSTAGARPSFRYAPPLPSPLNCVVSGGTQHPTTGSDLKASSADRPAAAASQGVKDRNQISLSPPQSNGLGEMGADLMEGQGSRRGALDEASLKQDANVSTVPNDPRKPLDMIKQAPESSEPVRKNDGPLYRTRRPPPITNTWLKELETGVTTSPDNRLSPRRSQTFPLTAGTNMAAESTNRPAQRRTSEPSVTSESSWPLPPATQISPEKPPTQAPIPSAVSSSGRSYHSPSDSSSSCDSVNSVEQTASSRSSQPLNEIEPERLSDIASKYNKPEAQEAESLTPPKPTLVNYEADSPTDPAFQNGRLTPVEALGLDRTQTMPESPSQTFMDAASAPAQHPKPQTPLHPKMTAGNKGYCRGCSKIIAANQKSVSSADGRLTGRYHKECFSCTTCRNAFSTADFYVLKDQPYCAQHYHALNGSLCGSCGHGIEGQYLEAIRSPSKGPEKFHAKCFSCVMCRVLLTQDYFAHHGRFFCERDIHRVVSPPNKSPHGQGPAHSGPGGSSYLSASNAMPRGKFPERRSTKLMIMS